MAVNAEKPALKVLLCSPRGFCAGVVRAIDTVERALALSMAPRSMSATKSSITAMWSTACAPRARFSSRNSAKCRTIPPRRWFFPPMACRKSVPEDAAKRNFFSLDATCPLVTKVHREAAIHFKRGREILLIGHSHHPEVVGTLGSVAAGRGDADRDRADAATFTPKDPNNLAYVTQTTLSIDDTAEIVATCSRAFPEHLSARTRKTSATPPPTASSRSRRWRRLSTP
jgi:4-hydroxy-3-methylbut-2-enyl diphosphate reductase